MRIYQVMDALDYGDGVSNSVINAHLLLNKMGIENQIYSSGGTIASGNIPWRYQN